MPAIFVSIGSNINRDYHIISGINALKDVFGQIALSPIYETPAEGFSGDPFYNLAACFESTLSPTELNSIFKQIEDQYGRDRTSAKFSSRTLDIDLLLYGEAVINEEGITLPRDEIERYAFVLQPLADLRPNMTYPGKSISFQALWDQAVKDKRMQPGKIVAIDSLLKASLA